MSKDSLIGGRIILRDTTWAVVQISAARFTANG